YTKRKLAVQRDFKQDKFSVLVATKAFGMGVDKPNVRFTIHYNISQSLEAFYQEAGRAGRDRQRAECWIVFSDDQPKMVDRAFEADIRPEQIKRLINSRNRGDAERMLYLQQLSYPGREEET